MSASAVEQNKQSPFRFGNWHSDEAGLPFYAYDAPSNDPYFILGNHRLTLFTHVDGRLQMLTGERSWMRLNHIDGFKGGHEAEIAVDGKNYLLTGTQNMDWSGGRREFGCGFALYESVHESLRCKRIFSAEPDKNVADAVPAITARVELLNESAKAKNIRYCESFRVSPRMLKHQWMAEKDLPIHYEIQPKRLSDNCIHLEFLVTLDDPHAACAIERPATLDAFPPQIMLVAKGAKLSLAKEGWIKISFEGILAPQQKLSFSWAVALAYPSDEEFLEDRLGKCLRSSLEGQLPFRKEWSNCLPQFNDELDQTLAQELTWHAHTLEAMAIYSSFYKETFIPQGTNYDYSHAFLAAPRDHLQHALGVMYTRPNLAKSAIRYVFQKIDAKGEIIYTDCGVAMTSNGIWHTSDQQLYLFFVVAEYLRITKDFAFLAEKIRVYPAELGCERTVFEQIERAFGFLRDEVGFGLKGLPRILNSDWNDGIFYNRPLRYGEYLESCSHANAAMVGGIIDPLRKLLETGRAYIQSVHLDELLASMQLYREKVTNALLKDMQGRDYSRRAYLGDGSILGEDNMFLEPQPWLLMTPEFKAKDKLLKKINEKLEAGEVLGSRCIEIPITGKGEPPVGEAENGAFWYALQGQLIVATAKLDTDAALVQLRRMSMHQFSENYPDIWYGQWSGSDTFNSETAAIPGRMTSLDPRREITPIPCAHAHAYPLYAYHVIQEAIQKNVEK